MYTVYIIYTLILYIYYIISYIIYYIILYYIILYHIILYDIILHYIIYIYYIYIHILYYIYSPPKLEVYYWVCHMTWNDGVRSHCNRSHQDITGPILQNNMFPRSKSQQRSCFLEKLPCFLFEKPAADSPTPQNWWRGRLLSPLNFRWPSHYHQHSHCHFFSSI